MAALTPLRALGPFERLRRSGDVSPASRRLRELGAPLALQPGQEPASAILARLRSDER